MKPRVITKCVASHYAGPNERIIEFSSRYGGGLISLMETVGGLRVDLYRLDPTVTVTVAQSEAKEKPTASELTPHQTATLAKMRKAGLDWVASATEREWKGGQAYYIDTRCRCSKALRAAFEKGNREALEKGGNAND